MRECRLKFYLSAVSEATMETVTIEAAARASPKEVRIELKKRSQLGKESKSQLDFSTALKSP